MISVLDLLRQRLGSGSDRVMEDMLRGNLPQMTEADRRPQAMGPVPPSYLPEAVWRSILENPVSIEGERAQQHRSDSYQTLGAPLFEQEAAARAGPQRESGLMQGLNDVRNMGNTAQAIPEGWGLTSRPEGQSPFAGPLNQMMQLGRRAPWSLY